MCHFDVVGGEDRLDGFGEGGMVGNGGRQRRCCAVELSVELSGCHYVGIVEFWSTFFMMLVTLWGG